MANSDSIDSTPNETLADEANSRHVRTLLPRYYETGSGYHAPVSYENQVYAFRAHRISSFSLSRDGTLSKPKDHPDLRISTRWGFIASCVYQGRVYAFFDRDIGGWKHQLRYKVSVDIAKGAWEGKEAEQDEQHGYDSGAVAGYEGWGARGIPQGFRAVVFDDKLHLFYWRDRQLHLSTYDGNPKRTWKHVGALKVNGTAISISPQFAVTGVMIGKSDPKPALCLATLPPNANQLALYRFDATGGLTQLLNVSLKDTYASAENQLSLAYGSVQGGTPANVVQVFCNNTNDDFATQQLRRLEVNLDTAATNGWYDTKIINSYPGLGAAKASNAYCDTVSVPLSLSENSNDWRNHLLVFTTDRFISGHGPLQRECAASCYASDLYVLTHDKQLHMENEPRAWTLLGVIEGLPPFATNGNDPAGIASVLYGQSNGQYVELKQTFGGSVGVSAGVSAAVDIGMELKASFGVTTTLTKRFTSHFEWKWESGSDNPGTLGWRIVSVPTIRNRIFERFPHAGRSVASLGLFHVTTVESVTLRAVSYQLTDPPGGMRARPRSDNPEGWRTPFVEYAGIPRHPARQAIYVEPDNMTNTVLLGVGQTTSTEMSGSVELTLNAGATIKEIFKIGGSTSFSFSLSTTMTSDLDDRIEASLKLPGGGSVKALEVMPAWYLPEPHVERVRPHWVSDNDAQRDVTPWCLTWHVTELRTD